MKRLTSGWVAVAALAAAMPGFGQIGGPVSGWILDERSGAIRAIVGIPGASYLGAAVTGPETLAAAAIHSGSAGQPAYAVAAGSGSGTLFLMRGLGSPDMQTVPFEHGLEGAEAKSIGLALSRNGRHGVVFDAASGRLRRISGLPEQAVPGDVLVFGSGAAIARVAVLNSGDVLVQAAVGGAIQAARLEASGWTPVTGGQAQLLTLSESGLAAVYLEQGRIYRAGGEALNGQPLAEAGMEARSIALTGKPGAEIAVVAGSGAMRMIDAASGAVVGEFSAPGLEDAEIGPGGSGDDVMVAGKLGAAGARLFLIDVSAPAMARAAESGNGPVYFVPVNE